MKTNTIESRGSKKRTRTRVGETMFLVTIAAVPAVIDFDEILEETRIENDDGFGPPWKEHDGWEHKLVEVPEEGMYNPDHVVREDRKNYLIYISKAQVDEWGAYAYHGASRQVQTEAKAANLAKTYAQLAKWYNDGYNWRGVVCDYAKTIGERDPSAIDSLWGILVTDSEADEEYLEDVRYEVAENVAHALEKLGYTVEQAPRQKRWYRRGTGKTTTRDTLREWRARYIEIAREQASRHPTLKDHYLGGKLYGRVG